MPATNRIFKVDSFTESPFHGNPAGVCLLEEDASDDWMQAIAAEMNVSETAFIRPLEEGFSVRYFTPKVEVPLCGHATLASAHILWEERRVPEDARIDFRSKSGRLSSLREGEWVLLDFPSDPPSAADLPAGVGEALGALPKGAYRSGRLKLLLLEYDSEDQVSLIEPDYPNLHPGGLGGVVVTAKCDAPGYDFVSRFFAPELGINEDPVTGAAHTILGPFWAGRIGVTEMVGRQISKRGGVVRVRTSGDRVHLLGMAVTVLRGELVA